MGVYLSEKEWYVFTRIDTEIRKADDNADGAYLIEVLTGERHERISPFSAWTCSKKQYDMFYRKDIGRDCVGRIGGMCFVNARGVTFWNVGRSGCELLSTSEEAKKYATNWTVLFLENEELFKWRYAVTAKDEKLRYLAEAEQLLLRGELPPRFAK